MKIINASINLNRMKDLQKRAKKDKNGNYWLPIAIKVFNDVNEYGQNVSIKPSSTEEERKKDAKVEDSFPYIGNGKVVYSNDLEGDNLPADEENDNDDLPF